MEAHLSGAIKSVGKIFKSITKSWIGKIIIAAVVTYFTMGIGTALLGATGLGLSGTLSAVLAGAIDGAIAGGITSALTGGDIGKGILYGGVGGAVFGGAKELMGIGGAAGAEGASEAASSNIGDTAANIGGEAAAETATGIQEIGLNQEGAMGLGSEAVNAAAEGASTTFTPGTDVVTIPATESPFLAPGVQSSTQGATTTAGSGGLLGDVGTFIEKNPTATMVAGSALMQGVGAGITGNAQANAIEDATAQKIQAEQAQKDAIRQSHDGMNLWTATPDNTPRPTPAQRFDPNNYRSGSWVYDPQVGQIRFIKSQPA